jgi:hypothetical protein
MRAGRHRYFAFNSIAEVFAVDRDAGVIAETRRLATFKSRLNVRWLESREGSYAIDDNLRQFGLHEMRRIQPRPKTARLRARSA